MKIHRIWEAGDICVAVADGGFGVTLTNDMGGTQEMPKGRYKVRIVEAWEDDETGQRMRGELLDEKAVAKARKAGTTPFTPKVIGKQWPKVGKEVARTKKAFNPKIVYFSEFNCKPMEVALKA